MGRLGHARSPPHLTTTPMLPFERKASASCIGRAIVVNGPAKLLRVASITASARRSALRFEPDQTQPSIAGLAVQRRRKLADLLQALTDCPKARPVASTNVQGEVRGR